MKTPMICLEAVLACCFAVYGQQGTNPSKHNDPFGKCTFVIDHQFASAAEAQAELEAEDIRRGCNVSPKPEPIDVAPQQWATYEPYRGTYFPHCVAVGDNGVVQCDIPPPIETKHWGCADPKRVLLTSEDQVKHCFDFSRLGDALR